ncbi:MAG TPA: [protein-PII] uridylyltransferase, partial [Verrucomicrobiae bacterium]|nr:[protein-PII] uridylyltransferase [Verrucomicrobiae bacterium]
EEELQAHFSTLPARYFQIHPAREILDDLILANRFMRLQLAEEDSALTPVVNWHNEPDRGCNVVKICTWDRAGLFSKIAGSFTASGINILSAQIFTRNDGIVLDTFFVTDARTGTMVAREHRDTFEDILLKVLTEQITDLAPLIARQKISRPLYQSLEGERIPLRVQFDNDTSETRTVIDIETEDRLGLLYAISQVFADQKLDLALAKISTEKGAAIDTFYVTDLEGQKIYSPEYQRSIHENIRRAIANLDR